MELLDRITELSHEFGTMDYVRGGGGNTSVKNDTTLWVKPSGTTLAGLTPETFVALDRSKLSGLYAMTPPVRSSAREALVKEIMERATLPDRPGRASVEAPLHDSLSARYVVHTHPALVNGMTCGKDGGSVCCRSLSASPVAGLHRSGVYAVYGSPPTNSTLQSIKGLRAVADFPEKSRRLCRR